MIRKLFKFLIISSILLGCQSQISSKLEREGYPNGRLEIYNFDDWNLSGKNFTKAKLYKVKFRRANLSFANFTQADLQLADLRGANLYRANFTASNIHQAWLNEATLRAAIFDQTDFKNADFSNFDLRDTSFVETKLQNSNFRNSNLKRADFTASKIANAVFNYADLESAVFMKTDLTDVKLEFMNLRNADFTEAKITGVSFRGSDLTGAKFDRATLTQSSFQSAHLKGSSFVDSKIALVNFDHSHIQAPDFHKAQLTEIHFKKLDLSKANFDKVKFKKTTFDSSNLTAASFKKITGQVQFNHSELAQSNFRNANLDEGLFKASNFAPIDFRGMVFPRRMELKSGITFIQIPQGCYEMGDQFNENTGFKTSLHEVCLHDYWLAETELTQEQWSLYHRVNPSLFINDANQPVERITPLLAEEFTKQISRATGWKMRLPTEAEWEYACRELGQKVRFGNGGMIAQPDQMAFQAQAKGKTQYSQVEKGTEFHNFGTSWKQTVPVRLFKANQIGLYEMSGNVEELVADHWAVDAYKNHEKWNPIQKPIGENQFKVKRGGSWFSGAADLRCAKRSFSKPKEDKATVGLRLAWEGPQ